MNVFTTPKQRAAREAALKAFEGQRPPDELGAEARRVLQQMVRILEGIRTGMPPELAADRARVPRSRLQLWRELGTELREPFRSFARELSGQRADADFEIATSLRTLAAVDARASMALGAFEERLDKRARAENASTLLDCGDDTDTADTDAWRALLSPADTEDLALPAAGVVAIGRFEPRRNRR